MEGGRDGIKYTMEPQLEEGLGYPPAGSIRFNPRRWISQNSGGCGLIVGEAWQK